MFALETALRAKRDAGEKLLIAYVTGGVVDDWIDYGRACIDGGADAVEIGLPFSDPTMDGPVIQTASQRALDRGVTMTSLLNQLSDESFDVPILAMTYANVLYHGGYADSASALVAAGVSGVIIPDLPIDEVSAWKNAVGDGARQRAERVRGPLKDDITFETVLLAAPSTSDERLERIAKETEGFLYCVGVMGVTGERDSLAESAITLAKRAKAITDKPVCVGVGISNADQARQACEVADGVIVGSAIMQRILNGEPPDSVRTFVESLR